MSVNVRPFYPALVFHATSFGETLKGTPLQWNFLSDEALKEEEEKTMIVESQQSLLLWNNILVAASII